MQARLLICVCVAFCLLSAPTAVQGLQEQPQQLDPEKSNSKQSRELESVKAMDNVEYEGDYSPSANVDTTFTPPPPLRRRLLQDYTPVSNQRSPSAGRKLLQDYSPTPNQRISSPPPPSRKLLQAYNLNPNQRSRSIPRQSKNHLHNYNTMANKRPSVDSRMLFQDYSPTANQRQSFSP